MPQDYLQIALEHHRAGRLKQAERGYRALLDQDPHNADASHWLGVLFFQAGRAEQAIPLLEAAVAARPDDAAFLHNLGQAYLQSGRVNNAITLIDRSLDSEPARAESLFSAAVARLARKSTGDAEGALLLLTKAQAAGLGTPELHQHLGIALLMTGQLSEAIGACKKAIAQRPDYAEAHHHLGVAYWHSRQIEDARASLVKAVELRPTYARAIHGLAVLEAETGRHAEAEALFRRAIKLKPDSAAAHQGLGALLTKMGRQNEATLAFMDAVRAANAPLSHRAADSSTPSAIADLERKLTPSADESALHFQLAKQTSVPSPNQIPASSVSNLFNQYADLFDEHLRGKLDYRAPELIVEAILATRPDKPLDILDLGCGTGLCGPILRPLAATLAGVDLSPAMVEKARERKVYDRLEAADMIESMGRWPLSYDLLVAADVLMYLGDLAPTFEAAVAALRPGGLFAFSVEAGAGDRFEFNKAIHRYTHSKPYLRHLARIYGFAEASCADITVRKEGGIGVLACLMVLRIEVE